MNDYLYDFLRILVSIPIIILIFIFFSFAYDKVEVSSNITEGVIVDKQMYGPGFFSIDRSPRYVITIEATYEYKGKEEQTTKEFTVDEGIYVSYKIGDWFDSQNPVYIGNNY